MPWRRAQFGIVLALLILLCSWDARAQDYPSRFIRVVVGPGPDIVARLFGAKITDVLRQQVVVEPRPGAGGTIASQTVAAAAPDGYTLLLASASYTINTALQQSPYDLAQGFRSGRARGHGPVRAGGASVGAGEDRRRADRLRQGKSRQAQLRLVRHRHAAASRGRIVQVDGRRRHRACALTARPIRRSARWSAAPPR